MNNKYDVKNFSDLIDQFNIKDEVKVIEEEIKNATLESRVELSQTIFDPLIDSEDRQKAKYEFSAYRGRRYDLNQLHEGHKLLIEPP